MYSWLPKPRFRSYKNAYVTITLYLYWLSVCTVEVAMYKMIAYNMCGNWQ